MLSYASLTNLCFACQFPPEGCAERQSLGPLELLAVHEFPAWVLAGRGRREGVCWQLIRYCCFALPLPADADHPLLLLDWMPRGGWGRRKRAGSCWPRGSSGGWWKGWRGGRSGHRGGPPSSGQTAPTSLRLSDLWLLVLCEKDLLRLGREILNSTLDLVDWTRGQFWGKIRRPEWAANCFWAAESENLEERLWTFWSWLAGRRGNTEAGTTGGARDHQLHQSWSSLCRWWLVRADMINYNRTNIHSGPLIWISALRRKEEEKQKQGNKKQCPIYYLKRT